MAACLFMHFPGVDASTYETVLEKLGLRDPNPDWPKGFISHVAGFGSDGLYVVDVWQSKQDFEDFVENRLRPAFEDFGGLPQPNITTFEVHNTLRLDV
jgi:hypothetical protein